jgi:hypothetical protein
MVGVAFCRCRVVLENPDDWEKNGVTGLCRVAFAHEEHVQPPSCRTDLDIAREKLFIATSCELQYEEAPEAVIEVSTT